MKIFTIIGARPQFIKSVAISKAIEEHFSTELTEVTLHTGQHYDENMSQVFFNELEIPSPKYRLDSNSNVDRVDAMTGQIKEFIQRESPNAVLVYGDTDSTLAGAKAGAELNIPIVHVEAGLRSFNSSMPEENNRIQTDQLSTLLFSPTQKGIQNLMKEGFKENNEPPYSNNNPKIYHCGDVMYDNAMNFAKVSDEKSTIVSDLNLPSDYILATVHRNYNTDNPKRLNAIVSSFLELANSNFGFGNSFTSQIRKNALRRTMLCF